MRFVARAPTLSTRPKRKSLASLRVTWSLLEALVPGPILFLSASLLRCSFFTWVLLPARVLPAFSVHICQKPKSKMVPTSTMMPNLVNSSGSVGMLG
jgi:hypothetical protein